VCVCVWWEAREESHSTAYCQLNEKQPCEYDWRWTKICAFRLCFSLYLSPKRRYFFHCEWFSGPRPTTKLKHHPLSIVR